MMTTALLAGTGVITGLLAGPTLRRLPEPVGAHKTAGKVPYRQVASRRFAVVVAACSVAALLVVAARVDPALWPVWLPLATIGVLLAGIDAVTTWLPLRLTQGLWSFTAAGFVVAVAMTTPLDRTQLVARGLLGAAAVGGFFWLFWWFTNGIGFGDVRLAPVLGVTAASVSFSAVVLGLLAGSLVGAAHGIVRRARGRAGPFPYGPALVIGIFAGLVLVG